MINHLFHYVKKTQEYLSSQKILFAPTDQNETNLLQYLQIQDAFLNIE